MRSGGMNRSTLGTPPALHPQPGHETEEIPKNEPVAPETRIGARGTASRFLPGKALVKDLNTFQIQPNRK
jgi:hypothetical protein